MVVARLVVDGNELLAQVWQEQRAQGLGLDADLVDVSIAGAGELSSATCRDSTVIGIN